MEKKYPIDGYAPGNYHNRCATCEKSFFGDKQAIQCEPCAIEAKAKFDALPIEEQMQLIKRNGQIARVLFYCPASPERDLILRIVEQWGNVIEMPNMEQWLKDYAATRQSSPVWVKASERKPDHYKVDFKDKNGNEFKGNYSKQTGQYYAYGFKHVINDVVEWKESGTAAASKPTFWDVAKAFKWASEYKSDKGESLMLADGWCLMSDGGVNDELTPWNVAELYCLQCGYNPTAAAGSEEDKEVIEFIRDVAENWDCDPDSHTYNLRCRKCEATKLYQLFKQKQPVQITPGLKFRPIDAPFVLYEVINVSPGSNTLTVKITTSDGERVRNDWNLETVKVKFKNGEYKKEGKV